MFTTWRRSDDADRGDEEHDPQHQPDRANDHPPELAHGAGRDSTRERRQEHDAEREADHAERDLHQRPGDVVARHGTHADARGKHRRDDEGDLVRTKAKGARHHQQQHLARRGVGQVDVERQMELLLDERNDLDAQVEQRAEDDTDRQRLDAQGTGPRKIAPKMIAML